VFASVETNVSIESLRASTTTAIGEIRTADDGREILVRGETNGVFPELFLTSGSELSRYILVNEVGLPVTLSNLVFAETQFSYRAQVSVTVSQAGFQRIGCSGPFELFAPPAQARAQTGLNVCYAVVNNQVFEFTAVQTVEAPRGQVAAPTAIRPPAPGVVQFTLQAPRTAPTATPLPNVRLVPLAPQPGAAVASPTPLSGLVAVRQQPLPQCQGNPGASDVDGLPENLPERVQLSGVAYRFARQEPLANDVNLTRIGCVGPFEAAAAVGTDQRTVVFLRVGTTSTILFRYESATSFTVDFTVTGDTRSITAGDLNYSQQGTWQRSVYSSVSVIVYAEDPQANEPPQIYAVRVDGDVIAEYVPEGGDVVDPTGELLESAETAGVNPDLILGATGRRYVLVAVWRPVGTTTNGWVTLYSSVGEGTAPLLLATDPRSLDLFFYRRTGG